MTTSPSAPVTSNGRHLVPPEERFWERYSGHNEAPLSGVSSTVIHLLILGLLVLVVWVQGFLKLDEVHRSIPVEPIRFTEGDGNRPGGREGLPLGDPNQLDDSEPGVDEANQPTAPKLPRLEPLPVAQAQAIEKQFPTSGTAFAKNPTDAIEKLSRLGEASRRALSKGGRGDKSGTDKDGGSDKDQGGDKDKSKGLTPREKRQLRWGMTFNSKNSTDYLNQLKCLRAALALPIDEKKGIYRLIEDLARPKDAPETDVSTLDRIFWIDDKESSVKGMYAVLGMEQQRFFVAFFPRELEQKMERLELAYTEQKYRHRDVDKIHETKFEVYPTGKKVTDSAGQQIDEYDVKVTAVSLKK